MRSRIVSIAGISVAALALGATFAPVASAGNHAVSLTHHGVTAAKATPQKGKFCAKNNGKKGDTLDAIVSQNFEAANAAFDSTGAADFKTKKKCTVTEVDVNGQYFNGTGPADSVDVTFYKNAAGVPGAALAGGTFTGLAYTGSGSFAIAIPGGFTVPPGTHWVGVAANMSFSAGGEWGWENSSVAHLGTDQWENVPNGFACGTTWIPVTSSCLGSPPGPSLMFALKK